MKRNNCCLHCGKEGHKAQDCVQKQAQCPACTEAGRAASHQIGRRQCPVIAPPRGAKKGEEKGPSKKRASEKKSGAPLPESLREDPKLILLAPVVVLKKAD